MKRTYIVIMMILIIFHTAIARIMRKRQDLFEQRVEIDENSDSKVRQDVGPAANPWYTCSSD